MGLSLNIHPVNADWTWTETIYIRVDGSVTPDTAPISTVDNVVYTLSDNISGNVSEYSSAIVVERDNIVVDAAGYTLQGTGSGMGMNMSERSNVTVRNMRIKAFDHGIGVGNSLGITITGNNITANSYTGILLWHSSNNSVSGNNITANKYYGISLWNSSNYNSISGNNMVNNNHGIFLCEFSSNNTLTGNNITANHNLGIELWHALNNIISGNYITNNNVGIVVNLSSNNTLTGNDITNNYKGIKLYSSSNNTISGNNITANSGHGIVLDHGSSNNIICENNILENDWEGLWLSFYSNNNTISGNNVTNNGGLGVSIAECSNTTITRNNVSNNNQTGVVLGGSAYPSYNVVSENNIANNGEAGIWLMVFDYCDNLISGNDIVNNSEGIRVIPFHGAPNNTIYHNNFINNTMQVNLTKAISSIKWDDGYPSGGNYWSDHEGRYPNATEIDGSGIWGTPYVIDENNTDRYPLMAQYVAPQDTTLPTISVLSPEDKTYTANGVSLTFTVSGSTSWMGYSLDGQANVTITGNKTLSNLSDGLHSLIVYANDTAGNMGTSEMVYFTIEIQQEEAFPTWIVAIIVIIAVFGVALLVYFTKVRKTAEKT